MFDFRLGGEHGGVAEGHDKILRNHTLWIRDWSGLIFYQYLFIVLSQPSGVVLARISYSLQYAINDCQ